MHKNGLHTTYRGIIRPLTTSHLGAEEESIPRQVSCVCTVTTYDTVFTLGQCKAQRALIYMLGMTARLLLLLLPPSLSLSLSFSPPLLHLSSNDVKRITTLFVLFVVFSPPHSLLHSLCNSNNDIRYVTLCQSRKNNIFRLI